MRSNKRYSNVTFTKRVDHEGREDRRARAMPEPAVCESCGAVRTGRRWTTSPAAEPEKPARSVVAQPVLCPACRQAATGEPRGFVTVDGRFLAAHRNEIVRLLTNEAERAAEDNPLARILRRRSNREGGLVVSTTTEHLAQRLGHALERAYGGDATYDFSHENKLARVYWHRD